MSKRIVDAGRVLAELPKLILHLRALHGESPAGNSKHRAQLIASCIIQQLGPWPPEEIISDDGNSLITTYLQQVWLAMPWREGASNDIPTLAEVARLERWGELLSQVIGKPADAPDSTDSQPEQPFDADAAMQRVALAVGDETAGRILEIVSDRQRPAEERMKDVLRIDARFRGKDSEDWANLLGVSAPAVRKTRTWKAMQADKADAE